MWLNKTKSTPETPTLKEKVPTSTPKGRILTPDGNQILVGSSSNLVLIHQEYFSEWVNKDKTLLT